MPVGSPIEMATRGNDNWNFPELLRVLRAFLASRLKPPLGPTTFTRPVGDKETP